MINKNILLKITNLKKSFKEKNGNQVQIFEDINLEIGRGEILGIMGQSGCGKTTLLRTILRLEKADSGSVLFNSVNLLNIDKHEERLKIRKYLRYVYQHPEASLNPGISIETTLLNTCRAYGHNLIERKIDHSLELVGLPVSYKTKFPHELSGGEKRRAALARALITEPKAIFADEPFSGLDKILQAKLIQSFLNIQRKKELSYVIVSHDKSIIKSISDRVFKMENGNLFQI